MPIILSGVILLLAAMAWRGFYKQRTKQHVPEIPEIVNESVEEKVAIGGYTFSLSTETLHYGQEHIALTAKETTLLKIFLRYPNEVIDRNLLLKLGWEDEGVITGRSLDMYISKLRKILARDESVSIKNVHGKGYCLRTTPAAELITDQATL